jgi:hypothetical protein
VCAAQTPLQKLKISRIKKKNENQPQAQKYRPHLRESKQNSQRRYKG